MEKVEDIQYNLYFHGCEIQLFYIFTAVKYSFLNICIIFINQYFLVFHYFVYNKFGESIRKQRVKSYKMLLFMTGWYSVH